jgi:protocatechuate 3,4-dioxygenase beta subunit
MTTRDRETMDRRAALELLGVVGATLAMGCGGSEARPTGSGEGPAMTSGTGAGACVEIPSETAGPFGDKTGMLTNPAYHRKDISEGKPGIPLLVTFTVVDAARGCSPVAGALVEIWHCDKDGAYSEYGGQEGVPDQTGTTFLRGLQPTDQAGKASFTTIYPGFYPGRVTHIHVEVHVAGKSVKVTQMAFPDAISAKVYTTPLYAAKGQNNVNNGNDGVFADGVEHELAELHGSTSQGFTASLTLGVAL